jgi:hypothetical protein
MFGWKSATRQKTNRMMETTGAYDGGATGVMTGVVAGTRVATTMGWRDVAALTKGDLVLTFDGGLQEVTAIARRPMWTGRSAVPRAFWPLMIPAGALENAKPMMVLPRQGVMLESDVAETVLGDPFALIPAAALEGVGGIERVCPNDPIEVVTLQFATDQVVFAEQGALLFCPAAADLVAAAAAVEAGAAVECPYEMLSEARAVALVRGAATCATGPVRHRDGTRGTQASTSFVYMAAA